MTEPPPPRLYVLAGVNGAGKSTIAGAAFRAQGANYYNPDATARDLKATHGAAWQRGRELLERAMAERLDFAFETRPAPAPAE